MMSNAPTAPPPPPVPQGNVVRVTDGFDPTQTYTELWLPDGRVRRILTAALLEDESGRATSLERPSVREDASGTTIPLTEERLEVSKRTVNTGRVVLQKRIQNYDVQLDESLAVRTFDIERVVLNQPVEAAPPVRQEGATTIYPVVEEQLIITKQLLLREEVRVTRRDTERRDQQTVTLEREHLLVERIPGDRQG